MYPQGVCRIRKPACAGNGCAIFPTFEAAWIGKNIRYPAADDLFRGPLGIACSGTAAEGGGLRAFSFALHCSKIPEYGQSRIPVFSMISHFICCFNSHPAGYDGSCAAAALSSPAWRIKNGVSQRDTPETRRFHSIHTPTGRVWNGKGLSHGLKTCHWHVFLTPFRVLPGASKTVYPQRDTPETRRFHSIHTPTGRVWNGKGLSHGLKTCHWHVFLTPFRVPPCESKTVYPQRDTPFLVRQKGLEPPTY